MSTANEQPIAALYVDPKGPYGALSSVDCWDKERDAKMFGGGSPVVAHPPCGPWGHPCQKLTWLLMVGVPFSALGWEPMPRHPTHVIDSSSAQKRAGVVVHHLPKSQRHITPPAFAEWLVHLARSSQP